MLNERDRQTQSAHGVGVSASTGTDADEAGTGGNAANPETTLTDRYGAGVEKAGVRHTPGPWKRGDCDGWIIWAKGFREVSWKDCPDDVEKGEGVVIAVVEHPTWGKRDREAPGEWDNDIDGEITANARLIAAAPDMLEALRAVDREATAMRYDDPLARLVRAAIAKATLPTKDTNHE